MKKRLGLKQFMFLDPGGWRAPRERRMDRGRTWGDETSPMVQATRPPGQSRGPEGNRAPEGRKERFTAQGGQEHRRGFAPLGLGYSLSYRGSAYAGCLAVSSMSSMATAISGARRQNHSQYPKRFYFNSYRGLGLSGMSRVLATQWWVG